MEKDKAPKPAIAGIQRVVLKNLEDNSHVRTRICQYKALENEKGIYIAKQIVLSKIEGQDIVLRKYSLKSHDLISANEKIDKLESENPLKLRRKLNGVEGKYAGHYFKQIFSLIPEKIRPEKRKGFKAYLHVSSKKQLFSGSKRFS